MWRRHGHGHGPAVKPGEIDANLVAHAVGMTLWTFGVAGWAIWSARRAKGSHVRWMPAAVAALAALYIHAIFFVAPPPGDHAEAHGALAWLLAAAVAFQTVAAVYRAAPVFRWSHTVVGRVLVTVLWPIQWWLGVGVACSDTSTAFIGHYSVGVFSQLIGTVYVLRPTEISTRFEGAVMAAAGGIGLVGDLAITPGGFTARRVQHLFLYATFLGAGGVELGTGSGTPAVVALASIGLLMLVHQHEGSHEIHTDSTTTTMEEAAMALTMAMHGVSGLIMLAAAGLRAAKKTFHCGVALLLFSVIFVASQPEINACWIEKTGLSPAIYGAVAFQIAATAAGLTVAAAHPAPFIRYTATKLVLSASGSESE